MAVYNNYSNNYNKQRGGNKFDKKNDLAEIEKVMPIDARFKKNYVDIAHDVMVSFDDRNVITKTKIRSIYNMLCDVIDNEKSSSEKKLFSESEVALRIFKVRVIYDCGRDKNVKTFVQESHIIGYMMDIGSDKEKFETYCQYFESLLAYHRFLYDDKD